MKQFACFQLDVPNECLWRNGDRISLTPKPFALLRYLVENPQRLVTYDELLEALWPETYVQPQVLRTYALELRKTLGDDADNPRFIQTVPKRGYRFISPVFEISGAFATMTGRVAIQPPTELVGRGAELKQLSAALARAFEGERQVVFITGEAGIGKTALADGFCRQIGADGSAQIARGQSVEGFAGKEAYYPVVEALAQLCASENNLNMLRQRAPGWYAQLPLASTEDGKAVVPSPGGERPLSEICEAIEAIAAAAPLVLLFEDLHWADNATLDLISALARRRVRAQLLVLATFRPGEVSDGQQPLKGLKQDLVMRRLCTETALRPLDKPAVSEYLKRELQQQTTPRGLSSYVHQHSEGNPLFMIAIVEHMIAQGYLRQATSGWQLTSELAEIDMGVPAALSELIELQIDQLGAAEQRLLEAASLVGVIFPAWAAAAALNEDLEDVEDQYDKLIRRLYFLHPAGHDELPDGTQSAFYVFAHGLYRDVLYRRQSPARRARRHRRVAERLLELFAGREQDISSELAMHFEAAGDWLRASQALQGAADNAMQRGAPEDAAALLRRALRVLENLADQDRVAAEQQVRELLAIADETREVLRA